MNFNQLKNKLIIAAMMTFALGTATSGAVTAEPTYDLSSESNRRAVYPTGSFQGRVEH